MMGLVLYLVTVFWFLCGTSVNAYRVRDTIANYPGVFGPEADAKEKAESALLVFLSPVWPGVALFFGARAIWSLIQDVRAYYFKPNRKENYR